jgi:hypothetical protein
LGLEKMIRMMGSDSVVLKQHGSTSPAGFGRDDK